MATQKVRPKEEVLHFVIDPNVKNQLRAISAMEGRSMAAQVGIFLKKAVEEFKTHNTLPPEEEIQPSQPVIRRSFSRRYKSE